MSSAVTSNCCNQLPTAGTTPTSGSQPTPANDPYVAGGGAGPVTGGGDTFVAGPEVPADFVLDGPSDDAAASTTPGPDTGSGSVSGGGPGGASDASVGAQSCCQPVQQPSSCCAGSTGASNGVASVGDVPPAPTPMPGGAMPGPVNQPVYGPDGLPVSPGMPGTTPGTTSAPGSMAGGPAGALPSWPQWEQAFAELGFGPQQIEQLAMQPLTNEQLSIMYMATRSEIVRQQTSGNIPGSTTTPPGAPQTPGAEPSFMPSSGAFPATGGWSPQWQQTFAELGLNQEEMAQLQQVATQNQLDDATLTKMWQEAAALLSKEGSTPGGQGPNGQAGPGAEQPTPGWNPQWEQRFRELGVPDEMLQAYAQLGAPEAGLQAAYLDAKQRSEQFKAHGYYDKLKSEGMTDADIWNLILKETPVEQDELKQLYEGMHKKNQPLPFKAAQMGLHLLPGGFLAQYLTGKKWVNGESIDRTNPMNMVFAGLSALALIPAWRGAKGILAGQKALANGLPEIAKLTGGPVDSAALGALENMSFTTKLKSWMPFSSTNRAVMGWGAAESGARWLNNGGMESLRASGPLGDVASAALVQMYDEFKTGQGMLQSAAQIPLYPTLSGLMPFKLPKGPMGTFGASSGGGGLLGKLSGGGAAQTTDEVRHLFTLNKMMDMSNPNHVVPALLEAAGSRIAANPDWLANVSPEIAAKINSLQVAEVGGMGQALAGHAAGVMTGGAGGNILNRLKPGAAEYFAGLGRNGLPPWASKLEGIVGGVAGNAATVTGGGGVAGIADDLARSAGTAEQMAFDFGDDAARVADNIDDSFVVTDELASLLDDLQGATEAERMTFFQDATSDLYRIASDPASSAEQVREAAQASRNLEWLQSQLG